MVLKDTTERRKPGPKPIPVEDRLWPRVDRMGHGCWEWTGWTNNMGYGLIAVGEKKYLVHRVAYSLLVGPIADGMVLDHLCRNPICVNPDHLEPVTQGVNVRRGRAGNANSERILARTHCKRGHEYTDENTYWGSTKETRSGFARHCRACGRLRKAAQRRVRT